MSLAAEQVLAPPLRLDGGGTALGAVEVLALAADRILRVTLGLGRASLGARMRSAVALAMWDERNRARAVAFITR